MSMSCLRCPDDSLDGVLIELPFLAKDLFNFRTHLNAVVN